MGIVSSACAGFGFMGPSLDGKWKVVALDSTDSFKEKYGNNNNEETDASSLMGSLMDAANAFGIAYVFSEGSTLEFTGDKAYYSGIASNYSVHGNKLELTGAGGDTSVFDYEISANTLKLIYDDKYVILFDKM